MHCARINLLYNGELIDGMRQALRLLENHEARGEEYGAYWSGH